MWNKWFVRRSVFVIVAIIFGGGLHAAQASDEHHVLKDDTGIQCEIVVPREAGPVARFAGEELQRHLSQALAGEVALLTQPSGEMTAIVLGNSEDLRQAGVAVEELPRDGFVIQSFRDRILVAGRDDMRTHPEKLLDTSQDFLRDNQYERGTVYGVYEFLERFVGVRFYFPDPMGIIVPRHETLTLPVLNVRVQPDHIVRHMGYSGALPDGTDGSAAYPFKNRHRLHLRTQTQYIPSVHGLREFDLMRRFGESHPEYFALMGDGKRYNNPNLPHAPQLCFSSEGLREQVYQDAKAYLEGRSAESRNIKLGNGRTFGWSRNAFQPGYVDLMPSDGLYPCQCDDCQKYYQGSRYRDIDRQGTSELIWDFVIDIAKRLEQNDVPGYVTNMAYSAYRSLPDRDLPDNVLVNVALRGPWNVGGYDDELELIKQWNRQSAKQVWLWNYIHKGSGLAAPGIPNMTPRAVGAYYEKVAPHIRGAYMSSTSDQYLFQHLNLYVAHKIFWDNDADVDALLDEYYQLMFGDAAPVMRTIYERFEDNWLEKIVGNTVETELGPASVPPSRYKLWEHVYSAEEIAKIGELFDAAERQAADDHAERVRYIRRALFEPLMQARKEYAGNREQIARMQHRVPELEQQSSVTIDGVLNEKAWADGSKLHLQPFEKNDGGGEYPPTLVQVAKDANHIYVAFDSKEPKMDSVRSSERERDSTVIFRDSSVEIFFNPSGDRKHYFHIAVNASGSISDLAGEKLGASQEYDWSWSSDAEYEVKHRSDGWAVELAIPLEVLGDFSPDGFPANFTRNRVLDDESTSQFTWSPFLEESFHEIENFGELVFRDDEAANLINNPGFAASGSGRIAGGWYHHPREGNTDESWTLDTNEFVTGGQSVRLTGRNASDHVTIKQPLPQLKPNTDYELSYFVKTDQVVPSRRSSGAYVSIWDEKNRRYPQNAFVESMPWNKQRFTFKTGPNVNTEATSYIALVLLHATGTVWYDDVRLVERAQEK